MSASATAVERSTLNVKRGKKRQSDAEDPSAVSELAQKVLRCIAAREKGGRHYKRADRALDEIAAAVKPGEEIPLNEAGRKAVLVDLYADKNVVFKPCGVRRYELKVIEP